MQRLSDCKSGSNWLHLTLKPLHSIRTILIVLLTVSSFFARATDPPLVTLSFTNANLEKVLKEIERQSPYRFIYSKETIERSASVTIEANHEEVEPLVKKIFEKQPIAFTIEEKYIILKIIPSPASQQHILIDVSGKIINQDNDPLAGITVTIKGTTRMAITGEDGTFFLKDVDEDALLIISGAEIEFSEMNVNKQTYITTIVKNKNSELDKVVMMAYGSTTRRIATGNIGKVSADQIGGQPVSDPIATLEGRVAGLVVTQSNGVPGSAFKVQIRGQNSIGTSPGSLPFNNPLFVIDGVPFLPGANYLNQLVSSAGNTVTAGLSPFNSINPNDIESIEILKDADATAIYGSLAANGVVLITTKKGKAGKTKFSLEVNSSVAKITREMKFLNTSQYIEMRKEAYLNDGILPTPQDAPDLLTWDTSRNTDWTKELIGGMSQVYNIQSSVSGGSDKTQFVIGAGYHKESTVFPSADADNKATIHLNLNHSARRLTIGFTTNYGYDNNKLTTRDLSRYLILPPDFPALRDTDGNLKWNEGGIPFANFGFTNPLSYTLRKYTAKTDNLISNLTVKYQLANGLYARINAGYNITDVDEFSANPVSSLDPTYTRISTATYGTSKTRSWIIEPQIEYGSSFKKIGLFNFLIGGSLQGSDLNNTYMFGSGYPNDLFLNSISAASEIQSSNVLENYRYAAAFARITYNLDQTYIVNLSGRRDGSSRFGPNREFGNFGAIGLGWILSNYDYIKKNLPFISFWKLRASYGTTGNDQIGNYQFLETWTNTPYPFDGSTGLYPLRLSNPDFSWEVNKKLEANIDLGLIKNKLLISVLWYRNRSCKQLVYYSLPAQTGFGYILENQPALVENRGWEFTLNAQIINDAHLKWSSSLNWTIPKNRLLAFPGLDQSPYANSLVIGQPLSVITGYKYSNVDPGTGLYQFQDIDKDGSISFPNDYMPLGSMDPKFYGGWENNLSIGKLNLSIMAEFRKQKGPDYLGVSRDNVPGFMYNQSVDVLNRWQKPGDITPVQKFTQTYGDTYSAHSNLASSDHLYSDASYIRIKNVALSYNIANAFGNSVIEECTLFLRAQNLLTITKYKAGDPETRNPFTLPPLRCISFGLKVSL